MKKFIFSILTIITISISAKAQMVIDSSLVVKTCLDCNDIDSIPLPTAPGSLYIEVSGGVSPYNFSLTGINPANITPSITTSLSGITNFYDTLCQDTFRLKITDNNGDTLIYNFSTIPPPSPYLIVDSVTVKADSTSNPDSGFIKLHVSTNADSVFYKIYALSLGTYWGWQDSTVFDSLPGGYNYVVFVDIYPKIIPDCGAGLDTGTSVFTIYVPLACENDGFANFFPPPITCVGNPVTIFDGSNPGSGVNNFFTNFIWDFGDGNFGSSPVATNVYTNPGTYIIQLQVNTSHGCMFFAAQPITIAPLPTTGFTNTDNGTGLYSFTDLSIISQGTINSWLWDFGDGNTSSAQNPNHQYATTGTYQVCLTTTSNFGCIDISCQSVNYVLTSIGRNSYQNNLVIFPNPTSNYLTIINGGLGVKELTIVDILGKTVKTNITNKNSINVAELPSGVYFIKVSTEEYTITQKFVKD